jgi:phosphoribosylanthranilate isomerase
MSLKIKICGMRHQENIEEISSLKPDMIGFIFFPHSKRNAGEILDPSHLFCIPASTKRTGVFVNETTEQILNTVSKYSLDFVQLHGNESPEQCRLIREKGKSVIKTFGISENFNFEKCSDYMPYTDFFLFDTSTPDFGGSGNKFRWKELKNYNLAHPFFISGGISADDIESLLSLSVEGLYGIDVNSRFETEPGLKNYKMLEKFISEIRKV